MLSPQPQVSQLQVSQPQASQPSTQSVPERTLPEQIHYKSLFQSKTFWSAIFTAIAAISPIVAQQVEDFRTEGINPRAVSDVVVILAGTGATIVSRVGADGKVYTPNKMPGPNKPNHA